VRDCPPLIRTDNWQHALAAFDPHWLAGTGRLINKRPAYFECFDLGQRAHEYPLKTRQPHRVLTALTILNSAFEKSRCARFQMFIVSRALSSIAPAHVWLPLLHSVHRQLY
jgi:hypothetical protein